jgi:hypothetical protein
MTETETKFERYLVDFDYETWRKFGLRLYYPDTPGKLSVVWPIRVLTMRHHRCFQIVGLVKLDDYEELIAFSMDTGRDVTGRCVQMDLDSLEPLERATTWYEIFLERLKFTWNKIRLIMMIILRRHDR